MTDYRRLAQRYAEVTPASSDAVGCPVYRTISNVEPEEVSWLSPGRIPFRKVTVLEGDPGLGKTMVGLDLAARLTRGEGFPGDPAVEPADVVILTGEDGIADTIRPRLEAAGAKLERIHALEAVRVDAGQESSITLPQDIPTVQRLLEEKNAKLVLVDVLNAFLSGAVDAYRDHDIRRALVPLKKLAEETGAAVVVVRHLRKAGGARAIASGGGSIGLAGAGRSVILVDQDPSDPDRRVLASVKCNLAAAPASLSFSVVTGPSGSPRIHWEGPSSETADSLAAARSARDGDAEGTSKVDEALDLLESWLGSGPMERSEVLRLGREAGYSKNTIERAAKNLNVYRHTEGFGRERRAYWDLRPISPTIDPNAPIDKNAGTNGGAGTNVDSKGLTGSLHPLFSHLSQPPASGTIESDGAGSGHDRAAPESGRRITVRL